MSGSQTTNTTTRRLISTLFMLALLGIFLSLYFLKYVPEQKRDYNRRAFMELQDVANAFTNRDQAYQQIGSNFHLSDSSVSELWHLFPRYTYSPHHLLSSLRLDGYPPNPPDIHQPILCPDSGGKYDLVYELSWPDYKQASICLHKSIDSLLEPLTAGDNDLFDSYLLILDSASSRNEGHEHIHRGEILFNPGQLSVDYSINLDSLLKNTDGFGISSIHDIKIEGNDYKLFLYPFRFHQSGMIMAGLVSQPHYTSRYESVPVDFITTGGILLLLLLVAIPLLKIYIIGSHERITTFDLRTIIGTYFIGGFVLFFLFAWNFMESSQTANDRLRLNNLASQLQRSFYDEIHEACSQLKSYDLSYHANPLYDSIRLTDYLSYPVYQKDIPALHPRIYRQFDAVYWINDTGQWIGRWGFQRYADLPLITVNDRKYFQDMKANMPLILKDTPRTDTFCLEPTLSRIEGTFVINIVIKSNANDSLSREAAMLGLSGKMYSVCNTILPPGYGFSIVDNSGIILFDSKMDRSLLSNIYAQLSDKQAIRQSIAYRQERFFRSARFHGSQTSLLVTPLNKLPYTAIVYYQLDSDKQFQLHVLGLSSFFIAWIILLLILAAFCNEWSRARASLSSISVTGFEWLRPVPGKTRYYRHLLKGMGRLAACYASAWVLVELILRGHEYTVFALSVLLPFFIAIHYFLLRERQKAKSASMPVAALMIPCLAIAVILIYLLPKAELGYFNKILILLFQLGFVLIIRRSLRSWPDEEKEDDKEDEKEEEKADNKQMLPLYVWTVITGVMLTVIIPAAGIFCFLYKEEARTRLKQETLSIATAMAERKNRITRDAAGYSFSAKDSGDNAFLYDLRFKKGIYFPDRSTASSQAPSTQTTPAHAPGMYYNLRNFLFPHDSTILTSGNSPESSGDSSWYFRMEKDTELLIHHDSWSKDKDTIYLPISHTARLTALGLLGQNAAPMGWANIFIFLLMIGVLLGLFYWLTKSLATRIFLLDIFTTWPKEEHQNETLVMAGSLYPILSGLRKTMKAAAITEWSAAAIRDYEKKDPGHNPLYAQAELKETYQAIWESLTHREQFVLYDFAIDNLANYKSGMPLFNLIEKGILFIGQDGQLHLVTLSFHNFVLNQSENPTIIRQMKKAREQGSWQSFKTPLFLVLAAAGLFVFLTQEDIYQKITGLLTSVSSLVPMFSRFFGKEDK